MQLTSDNLYFYLDQKGLVNTEAAINGHYVVHELNTRTQIKKVIMHPGPSLFIKQAKPDSNAMAILKREYDAYHLLGQTDLLPELSGSLPRLIHYDETNHILITELLPESVNLQEYYMNARQFPEAIARQQAAILASLGKPLPEGADTAPFPKIIPWAMQLHLHAPSAFFPENPENAKLISIITQNEFLMREIRLMAENWKPTHFIHGDIKWVNFLAIRKENGIKLSLIDWELADLGDPHWDAAGLLQSYISTWIFGFDNNRPDSQEFPEHFRSFHISAMQESAKAFLSAYMLHCGIPPENQNYITEKIARYTALRMIQTSIEGVEFDPAIKANNIRCIQLAYNLLQDPIGSLSELLNLKAPADVIS